jgi:uncharacterized membrane protein YkvA (DUF1232 family)
MSPFPLKERLKQFRTEAYTIYLELLDPRTPWYAKLLILFLLLYILSPIDIVPEPIPVIGVIDDIVVVSAGIWLLLHLIPRQVHDECKQRATTEVEEVAKNWVVRAIFIIILIASWIATLYFIMKLISKLTR